MTQEQEIKIFIRENPIMDESELFVYDKENSYSIKDGFVMATKRPEGYTPDYPEPFLRARHPFVKAIAIGLSNYLEKLGGINTEQINKGKIEVLKDDITWMRSLIEKQLK